MHWHINFASALLGNSILCSLPRYTTVIDSSSSLVFLFSCCTCCLFIFVLVFVMFSLIMLKLFWTVILKCLCGTVPITEDRSWRIHDPYLTPKGLDTTRPKMTDFALTVESSHRKSHFPRRYPDTFLFSPGDVNRLSVYLASVKKKKRLSETEKASASDPEWPKGGYVVKFLLILDIRWGQVVFRNKHFPLPLPSSANRYVRLTKWEGIFQGDDRIYSWPVTCNLRIAVLAVTNLSYDCTQPQQFYL